MKIIAIESESQTWELLASYLNDTAEIDSDEPTLFDFGKWLGLHVHLPNTPVDGSITPTTMEAMIALQEAVYRAYGLVSSGSPDLRYFTNEKKDILELRVQVEKGSSDYQIDLSTIIEKVGIEAVSKMTPETLAITILGLALIFGSSWAFRHWLTTKATLRQAELDSEERKAELEVLKGAIEQNTENVKILAQATARQPLLADVEAVVDPARQQLVQAVGKDGGGDLFSTKIDPYMAAELKQQKRQQSEEILLKGNFNVVKVDTTSVDGFRVTLSSSAYDQEITASLIEAMISATHREAIQSAEWAKVPVYVEMKAKKLRDRIFDAVVVLAELRGTGDGDTPPTPQMS